MLYFINSSQCIKRTIQVAIRTSIFCFLGGLNMTWGVESPEPKILILNSYHQGEDWTDNELAGILPTLKQAHPFLVPSIEHLDTKRFPHPEHLLFIKQYLKNKYKGKTLDLIFVLDNSALNLMTRYRDELFPGVPLVFAGINGYSPDMIKEQLRIAGVTENEDVAGTLNLALKLHPKTKSVLVVHDHTASGLAVMKDMAAVADQFKDKVAIHYNRDETADDLAKELKALPSDALVLVLTYVTDKAGRTLTREESTRLIADSSPVPVYAMHETRLGYGIIGGMLLEGKEHGKQAAEIALRILATKDTDSYTVENSKSRPVFDYRQLVRFKVDLDRLPANSVLINQPISFFQQHRILLIPGTIIATLLTAIILLLLISVTRIQKAKNEVKKSEDKYRGLFKTIVDGLILADPESRTFIEVNPAICQMTGYSAAEMTTLGVQDLHPEESLPAVIAQFENDLRGESSGAAEIPIKRKDGTVFYADVNPVLVMLEGKQMILGIFRDITERKKAQDAVNSTNKLLQTIIDTAPVRIFFKDRELRYLGCNTSFAMDAGQKCAEDLIGKDDYQLAWKNEADVYRADDLSVIESGLPKLSYDELQTTPEGNQIWLRTSKVPLRDETDSIIGVLGMYEDITLYKKTEKDLRDSEEKFRTVADYIYDWEYWRAVDGSLVYVSPSCYRITGYKAEEFSQDPELLIHIIHPDDRQNFRQHANDVAKDSVKGDVQTMEFLILTRNGEERVIEHICREVFSRDGESLGRRVTNRDITERKKAEAELVENSQRLQLATVSGKLAVWDWNIKDNIMFWDDRMFELYGICRDTFPRTIDAWINGLHPDDKQRAIAESNAACLGEKEFNTTFRVLHPDGTIKHLNANAIVIRDKNGNAIRMIGINSDITEQVQAEKERKALEAHLQQAQKMEAIGTLAGGIAHDFNNILGAILGYAEMVQEDCPPGSAMRNDIDRVVEASHRAKELVKQILAFSRQTETEEKPLQPALIIKEAIKMLRPSLPTTIDIQQNIDSDAGLILADPTQIHQILTNLCTNAFHAMEVTGGTLTISLRNQELDLSDLITEPDVQPGLFVDISVGDTGPGIPREIVDKIFDPFFTTKEVGKGTGMGLAIIHGIAKRSGGLVSFQSSPGEGTIFHVYLPVYISTSPQASEITPIELIQTGAERILYVDDEKMLAEMGKTMLERLGYRVTIATTSIEALKTIQNQPDHFDLVITDQTMPGITGSDLARRILQIRPEMPIILCTGFSNLISEEKARIYGIKGFAMKPLAKKDLATLVRKVLDGEKLLA